MSLYEIAELTFYGIEFLEDVLLHDLTGSHHVNAVGKPHCGEAIDLLMPRWRETLVYVWEPGQWLMGNVHRTLYQSILRNAPDPEASKRLSAKISKTLGCSASKWWARWDSNPRPSD